MQHAVCYVEVQAGQESRVVQLRAHPSGHNGIEFLAGHSEITRLIRAHDWSGTSLGSPEQWPPSLKNALRLVLAATQPMWIAWGRDLLLFPNDALQRLLMPTAGLPLVGVPIGQALPDMWPMLEPLLEGSMQRGESSVLSDLLVGVCRHRCVEETYVTLRFDPIPGDQGRIGGVLGTATATTEQVIGRRRADANRGLSSLLDGVRTAHEAASRALTEIGRHQADLPFALLYMREPEGLGLRLIATATLPAGTAASPGRIELRSVAGDSAWPVSEAIAHNRVVLVSGLPDRFAPLPAGDWPIAPRYALVVPLDLGGPRRPEAVLVAGVSARRALDQEYRRFIEQVASQVAAIVAAGRACERRQAEAAAAATKLTWTLRRTRERALQARFAAVLEERSRLAREIHDTLLQGFTGVGLQLVAALGQVTGPPETVVALRGVLQLVKKTLTEARCAVWDLRAPGLEGRDFPTALRAAFEEAAAGGGLALDFELGGHPRPLHADLEAVLCRVATEATANVVKHAGAQIVRLSLIYGARGVRLSVRDNGRGFVVDPAFRAHHGHWGLLGLRERALKAGAKLEVQSTPGQGTEVSLWVRYTLPQSPPGR